MATRSQLALHVREVRRSKPRYSKFSPSPSPSPWRLRLSLRSRTRRRAALTGTIGSAAVAPATAYDDATFKSVATQVGGDDYVALPGGLKYKQMKPGSGGAKAAVGDTVQVQFSGRCLNLNGKKFKRLKALALAPQAAGSSRAGGTDEDEEQLEDLEDDELEEADEIQAFLSHTPSPRPGPSPNQALLSRLLRPSFATPSPYPKPDPPP